MNVPVQDTTLRQTILAALSVQSGRNLAILCLQRVADKCPPEAEALGHDPAYLVRESQGE